MIEWLEKEDVGEWDSYVSAHPSGSIFCRTSWQRILEGSFSHVRGRYAVLREGPSRTISGGVAVYSARSWLLGDRWVSVPFASHVEPVLNSPADLPRLLEFLGTELPREKDGIIQIKLLKAPEVRLPPGWNLWSRSKHHSLDLRPGGVEVLASFSQTIRRWIQRSVKDGVKVRPGQSEQDWRIFQVLYSATRRRLGLPAMSLAFFNSLRNFAAGHERCFLCAELDGEVVGVFVGVIFNGTCLVEWIGDTNEGRRHGANHALYWSAIEDAMQQGCHTFSFGRTDNSNHGLLEFKRHWGTVEWDMPYVQFGGKEDDQSGASSTMQQMGQVLIKSMPGFMHAGFSGFCYQHLA